MFTCENPSHAITSGSSSAEGKVKKTGGVGSGVVDCHHVLYDSKAGDWKIKRTKNPKVLQRFKSKSEAIKKARSISQSQGTELRIHNMNGRISASDSHGKDSKYSKG